jgi:hypothetical protein
MGFFMLVSLLDVWAWLVVFACRQAVSGYHDRQGLRITWPVPDGKSPWSSGGSLQADKETAGSLVAFTRVCLCFLAGEALERSTATPLLSRYSSV